MVVGDFNLEPTDPKVINFLELNDMVNLKPALKLKLEHVLI